MIGIKLESGEFLTLPPTTTIPMVLSSSLFYDEDGGYSYPFTIPIEGNSEKLGFPEAIMQVRSVKKFNVQIYLYTNIWREAVLKIRNIVGGNYSCNISVEASVLSSAVSNKKLSELSLGGHRVIRPYSYDVYRLSGSGTTGNVGVTFYSTYSFSVPYNGTRAQTLVDLAAAIKAGLPSTYIFDVTVSDDRIKFHAILPSSFSPGTGRLFIGYIDDMTEEITNHMNETVLGSYPDYDYVFFPLKNSDFYSDKKPDYKGYVNYYRTDSPIGFIASQRETVGGLGFLFPVVPFPYLLAILRLIMEEIGVVPKGDWFSDSEIKKIVIYNNYSIDRVDYIGYSSFEDVYVNNTTGYVNLQNHVPDMTVGEFIKAIKSRWALGFFYYNEKNEVIIKTKNEILEDATCEDWTDIAEPYTDEEFLEEHTGGYTVSPLQDSADSAMIIKDLSNERILSSVNTLADLPTTYHHTHNTGDVRLVLNLNHYYKLKITKVGSFIYLTWTFFCVNQGKYIIGDGNDEINLASGTLDMKKYTELDDLDNKWLVPYAEQTGSSPEYELGMNPFSLRFLFYRGMQPGVGVGDLPITYPMATSYTKNYEDTVIGTRTFDAEEAYNNDHKKWKAFMEKTKPIKFKLRLSPEKLIALDYSKKKRISGVKYFLAKVEIVHTMKGPLVSVGTMYKIT